MLELAQVGADDLVYDLGCGDGRVVIAAARKAGARGVGVDLDPQRIQESLENARRDGAGDRVEFRVQDLFQTDIRPATVVMLYLYPEVNLKLRPKLFRELKPGTRIVSHSHDMGEWKPDRTVTAPGGQQHSLLGHAGKHCRNLGVERSGGRGAGGSQAQPKIPESIRDPYLRVGTDPLEERGIERRPAAVCFRAGDRGTGPNADFYRPRTGPCDGSHGGGDGRWHGRQSDPESCLNESAGGGVGRPSF